MNGIENISGKIAAEAQEKAAAILAQANAEAEKIAQQAAQRLEADRAAALEIGRKKALDLEEKAAQAVGLEQRKMIAATKQQMITEAFTTALRQLIHLAPQEYLKLLVTLTTRAVCDGEGGELVLSERDRELYGSAVVSEINAQLRKGTLSNVKGVVVSAVSQMVSKEKVDLSSIFDGASHMVSGKAITLAADTAPIIGGAVVRRGRIEINCALDVLIRMLSEEYSAVISNALFPKGA